VSLVASIAWTVGGISVGAVHVRALLDQASRPSRPLRGIARLVLVCAFAALAVRARAPAAGVGWVVGYVLALAFFSRRLRGAS
jgi:hypothetical protein